jgi:hypothetical protein
VATSLGRVEAALERQLATDEPLRLHALLREVVPEVCDAVAADAPIEESFASLAAKQAPPAALAWLDALYSDSHDQPLSARALRMLSPLLSAPLLVSPDGAALTFAELVSDFREYGHILYASSPATLPPTPTTRPVAYDPGAVVLAALQCVFSAGNVREASAQEFPATPPPLQAIKLLPTPPPTDAWIAHRGLTGKESREQRLLAAVVRELRLLGAASEELRKSVNLAWLQIGSSDEPVAVVCDAHRFIINRRHPAVQAVLAGFETDPQRLRFLASAVYTALSAQLGVSSQTDVAFHQYLAIRAASAARR